MNQDLLTVIQPSGQTQPPPAALQAIMKDVYALRDEMKAAGVWVFAGGLHDPGTATVVRVTNGEVLTTDGPFAEGKEHIGGFTIIRAAGAWSGPRARSVTSPR